jgi:hypothetical protein
MTKGDRLSAKQQAFVSYYLGEARMNATKAAAMAGYKTPRQEGARLLSNAVIKAEIEAVLGELRSEGIANKQNRLNDYEEIRRRLWQIADERKAEYEKVEEATKNLPEQGLTAIFGQRSAPAGGTSGFIVRQVKVIGQGRNQQVVEEFAADTALANQILAVNRQAAQELGEWSEKKQVTGANDGPIELKVAESAAERFLAWLAEEEAGEGTGEADSAPGE